MTATQLPARRKATTKSTTPAWPVTAVLLELAYLKNSGGTTKSAGKRGRPAGSTNAPAAPKQAALAPAGKPRTPLSWRKP